MLTQALILAVLGAVLGFSVRTPVLIAVTLVCTVVVVAIGFLADQSLWATAGSVLIAIFALQAGYVLSSLLLAPALKRRFRPDRPASSAKPESSRVKRG